LKMRGGGRPSSRCRPKPDRENGAPKEKGGLESRASHIQPSGGTWACFNKEVTRLKKRAAADNLKSHEPKREKTPRGEKAAPTRERRRGIHLGVEDVEESKKGQWPNWNRICGRESLKATKKNLCLEEHEAREFYHSERESQRRQ